MAKIFIRKKPQVRANPEIDNQQKQFAQSQNNQRRPQTQNNQRGPQTRNNQRRPQRRFRKPLPPNALKMQWRSPEKKWYLVQVERWIMSEVRKTGEFHTTYEEIQKRYPEMSHNLIEQIIRYMSNKEIVWCPVQPRSSAPVGVKRAVVFRIPDKKRGKKIKFYRWY